MYKVRIDRLEKMIKFLEELPPKKFDFGTVVRSRDENDCGTVCCAMGWTPEIFKGELLIGWDEIQNYNYDAWAKKIFGMSEMIADSLFCPNAQEEVHPDLRILSRDASPKSVAAMLTKFVHLVKTGEIEDHAPA